MMTITFIAGCKYTDAGRQVQIARRKGGRGLARCQSRLQWMTRACVAVKNYDAGLGSATVDVATGAGPGTETPAEVAGAGIACRE